MFDIVEKELRKEYLFDKDIDYPKGFFAKAFCTRLKKKNTDMSILYSATPLTITGSFTQNKCRSYVIEDSIQKINSSSQTKALVVFSGNANAITGEHAKKTILALEKSLGKIFNIQPKEILFSFTGVVGREFPYNKVIKALQDIKMDILNLVDLSKYSNSVFNAHSINYDSKKNQKKKDGEKFSKGIFTTDTKEKTIATKLKFKQGSIQISGCAKGAGMIYPNMATMLAYITTDIQISKSQLNKIHQKINSLSFNSINIDSDTSTNDTFLIISNGATKIKYSNLSNKEKLQFEEAILQIAQGLAKKIVLDGEGATKFITITIKNCKQKKKAQKIAKVISSSLLFKTAIFGNDANYGRVLVALGNCNEEINIDKVKLYFGKNLLFSNNKVKMKNIDLANQYLKENNNVEIVIDLNEGKYHHQFYTCDISYEYVKINAEYTT